MQSLGALLLVLSCFGSINAQSFTQESPYMLIRLMDLKTHEWKPGMLDKFEKVLDAELKYSDDKKGVECKSIDFEQEAGYPKQDARFLDLSIRGLCTDVYGKVHDIDKALITVAIERNIDAVSAVTGATVYRVGHVQFYKRNRNKLNLIIIPIAVGLTVLLFVLTFVHRRLRYAQKRRHIVSELEKKKGAESKKATTANTDPRSEERDRLLQLDPTVVGSASGTLGSPKDFTNEKYSGPPRTTRGNPGDSPTREIRGANSAGNFESQRSLRSSRERMQPPYEQEHRFPPHEAGHPDMIPLREQQPRTVIRTIRDDGSQQRDEPGVAFVPIPVHVERSGLQQRYAPPYHSDPYYRHGNS